jgi:hypothetical protein
MNNEQTSHYKRKSLVLEKEHNGELAKERKWRKREKDS